MGNKLKNRVALCEIVNGKIEPLRISSDNPKSIQDVTDEAQRANKRNPSYVLCKVVETTKGRVFKIIS